MQAVKLRAKAEDIRQVSLRSAKIRSAFLPAIDLLPNLGLIAVLGIGGHRVIDGRMTYGQMLEFMQYIALLIFPLRNLGMTVAFGQRAAAALLRVDEVLSTVAAVDDPPQPRSLPDGEQTGEVRFRRRELRVLTRTEVLEGFDLTIAPGARSRSSAQRAAASRRSPGC